MPDNFFTFYAWAMVISLPTIALYGAHSFVHDSWRDDQKILLAIIYLFLQALGPVILGALVVRWWLASRFRAQKALIEAHP